MVREITENDLPTINAWRSERDVAELPADILPKLGVIYGDQAAAWLYMDNSVGVCWMEWLSANPKNSLAESTNAFDHIIAALRKIAADNDYGVMMIRADQPGMVRLAAKRNFHTVEVTSHTMIATTGD